jgi:predicted acylesterase/phospholipase RssA
MAFTTLILAGGSLRGFSHLGAVQYLQDNGYFSEIKKFIGTSVGSIIGYLLAIGYSPVEIMIYLNQQQAFFEKLQKLDMVHLVNGNGALSFSIVQDFLEKMTVYKIKRYITLKELYTSFGKELILCTYNETLERQEVLSYQNHPDLPCITALRMSCNLPFLFEPFLYGDYFYLDGGIVNNFPLDLAGPDDISVGIHFVDEKPARSVTVEQNILARIYSLVRVVLVTNERLLKEKSTQTNPKISVISIPTRISIVNFSLTSKEKFDLFSIGYETARNYFLDTCESG